MLFLYDYSLTFFDAVSAGTRINDVANHRNEIYIFGATLYTEAVMKQSNTVIDQWCTLEIDLKSIIINNLLSGYTWENVKRIEIGAYAYAAAVEQTELA